MVDQHVHFDGSTYDPDLDWARLTKQLDRVRAYMLSSGWRSLREIELALGHPQASISARLRDLRKEKFGGYTVKHRRRTGTDGEWEYLVLPARQPDDAGQWGLF